MTKYKAHICGTGWVIKEDGRIINRHPSKKDLEEFDVEPYTGKYKDGRGRSKKYTDDELLNYLVQFNEENGRSPVMRDFVSNPEYPGYRVYDRFGGWGKAKKLVGLETIVEKGILYTCSQKGRLAEKIVYEHFDKIEKNPIDLAGDNYHSPCDGICPNGMSYEAKSSGLLKEREGWQFNIGNKYRIGINIYYFLAFNRDWTKLEYSWRVPGEMVEKVNFYIGMFGGRFNVGNMIEYEITDMFDNILRVYGFFDE